MIVVSDTSPISALLQVGKAGMLSQIFEELTRFREQGFELSVSEAAFEFLARCGIHKTLGARPM